MTRKSMHGFTLVEMMAVVTILGIALAIAIPSMTSFIAKERLRSAAGDWRSAFSLAKSEATKRNIPLYFVISANPSTEPGTWSLIVSTASSCALNAACDIKSLRSTEYKGIQVTALDEDLNGASIGASRPLPSFSTTQSITLTNTWGSIQLSMSPTGLVSQCSTPAMRDYPEC
ncbi:GspH/FimT family pseudopilin [Chitiniphilus shinanonensis]|uniref:GspH/FimT family pseudopilin n=1 Tax=Chitiniphilus shinanonensis TaxID=553088 RepID=UPI003340B980